MQDSVSGENGTAAPGGADSKDALAQFGPMASTVLKEWGLRNGKNVGEMVFLLIEEDVFSKQPEDSLDDFKGFMSFRKAFEEPYEFQEQPS